MSGIFERVGALAGTEMSKAIDLAHRTFQDRLGEHRHTGRALVETAAEVCRNHPNLVGIGAGLLVEQLLVHEKQRHDAHLAAAVGQGDVVANGAGTALVPFPNAPPLDAPLLDDGDGLDGPQINSVEAEGAQLGELRTAIRNAHLPHSMLKLSELKPFRVAMEVFGGILLLKLAATGAKMFRHKHQGEVWFAPAAKIRLFSGTIAACESGGGGEVAEDQLVAQRRHLLLWHRRAETPASSSKDQTLKSGA